MCSITCIWSDNAKTFKAANKELQQCWRILESDQTQVAFIHLCERKIQWKFIKERDPCWGGFYECLEKSVRTQLNSHPLTYIGADLDNYVPRDYPCSNSD